MKARPERPASSPIEVGDPSVAAEALAVRFGPLPFSAMRRVQRVLTETPRSRLTIVEACGCCLDRTSAILARLVRVGLALKLDAGYVRSGKPVRALQDDAVPMEIGRQILLCLTEPRRTRDIALIINRPPSNTTGQLQHLLRRGLVVRISKGVYDLARSDRPRASTNVRASIERPAPVAAPSHLDGA